MAGSRVHQFTADAGITNSWCNHKDRNINNNTRKHTDPSRTLLFACSAHPQNHNTFGGSHIHKVLERPPSKADIHSSPEHEIPFLRYIKGDNRLHKKPTI
jgi:proteasome lid subunit RPN8/RPN11